MKVIPKTHVYTKFDIYAFIDTLG